MRNSQWIGVLGVAAFLVPCSVRAAHAPAATMILPATSTASSSAVSSPMPKSHKHSHANDFLIKGTVFTPEGLSFPNVRIRLRRSGEKKFRWETYTNSRGDFAVRVPRGSEYEILVRMKGFADQTRTLNSNTGDTEDRVVFRMEPLMGGKK